MVDRQLTEVEITRISIKNDPELKKEIAEIAAHHARLAKIRDDMWKQIESYYGPLDPPALQKKA